MDLTQDKIDSIEENVLLLSTVLQQTFTHTIDIKNCFGNLPNSIAIEVFKDGRAFSHFIEP